MTHPDFSLPGVPHSQTDAFLQKASCLLTPLVWDNAAPYKFVARGVYPPNPHKCHGFEPNANTARNVAIAAFFSTSCGIDTWLSPYHLSGNASAHEILENAATQSRLEGCLATIARELVTDSFAQHMRDHSGHWSLFLTQGSMRALSAKFTAVCDEREFYMFLPGFVAAPYTFNATAA